MQTFNDTSGKCAHNPVESKPCRFRRQGVRGFPISKESDELRRGLFAGFGESFFRMGSDMRSEEYIRVLKQVGVAGQRFFLENV